MPANPIETELALIRRDIQEINAVLYGNGKDRQALIDRVETFAEAADRGMRCRIRSNNFRSKVREHQVTGWGMRHELTINS